MSFDTDGYTPPAMGRVAWIPVAWTLAWGSAAPAAADPTFGFTGFPYALTQQALDDVAALIRDNARLIHIHLDLDECIPWTEALRDEPFPQWFQDNWDEAAARSPAGHVVSLAATPTAQNRRALEAPCGPSEGSVGSYPSEFDEGGGINPTLGTAMAHPRVREAYENYVARAVEQFGPDYLTIGIEMTILASLHPTEYPAFEGLADQTRDRIHSEFPGLPVGVEHVLQTLQKTGVAGLVIDQIERNDFLGISFYPFGSSFGEFFGEPALPAPPNQWRDSLAWLETFTDLPVAIVETGYTSVALNLDLVPGEPLFSFPGGETLQDQFLGELVQTARSNDYLFVVWFIPVDYDLIPNMPVEGQIWTFNGLLDSSLQPKPAWTTWQTEVVPEPSACAAALAGAGALVGFAYLRRRAGAATEASPRRTGCV